MISLRTPSWSIDNVECILFDKDGTFIDLHFFWGKMTEMRALEVIKEYNLSLDKFEYLCESLGYGINNKKMLPNGITALYSRAKIIELFNLKIKALGVESSESTIEKIFDNVSEVFYKNINEYIKPIESAINFIKKVHQAGVRLGIVTSDSVVSTNLALRQFGWEYLFDVVIGRESSEYPKESGIPTKLALEKLKADCTKTIMIGDAPTDYLSAKNAGIEKTILVSTGQVKTNELLNSSRYVVNSLKELIIK